MKVIWRMTEKNWENYVSDNEAKRNGEEVFSEDADVYGAVIIGNIRAELQHTLDKDDWYAFANVFALGIDDGYGEENGIPYTLLHDAPHVPIKARTFEDFKKAFEDNFKRYVNTLPKNVINNLLWEDCK